MAKKNLKNQKQKSQVHNSTNRKSAIMNKMELRDYVDAFNKLASRHYETKNFEKALEVLNKKYKHLENQLLTIRLPVTPPKLPLLIDLFTMQVKTSLEKAEVLKKLGKIEDALDIYNFAGHKIQSFLDNHRHSNLKKEIVIDLTAVLVIKSYEYAKMHIRHRNFKSAQEVLSPCLAVIENYPNHFKIMKKIDFFHKSFDMMELWSKMLVVRSQCYYKNEIKSKKCYPEVKRNIGLSANSAMVRVIVGKAFATCD